MAYEDLCTSIEERAPVMENTAAALYDVAADLREMKNAAARVHRIPSEILAQVFHYFVCTQYNDRDLIAMTHVCRRWRAIALDNPDLWSYVVAANLDKAVH